MKDGKPRLQIDFMNWMDIAAILPFYFELARALAVGEDPELTVSGAEPTATEFIKLTKVLRIFKMCRHFDGAHVIFVAAKNSAKRLIIPIFFLVIFVLIFAAFIFETERGAVCYYDPNGDYTFTDPDDPSVILRPFQECLNSIGDEIDLSEMEEGTLGAFSRNIAERGYEVGQRIMVDDSASETQFPDIVSAGWLTIVTMTTVGYGVVSPITKLGKSSAIGAMLFGTFYLAMPLTIVGGTFWEAYTENEAKKKQAHAAMDAHAARDKAKAKGDEFSGIRYQAMELEPMKKVMRQHDLYIEYILKPAEERYFDNGKSILGELDKCMAALEKEPESAAKEVMERVMGCQTRLLLLSGVVHALKIDGQVLHG